MVDVCRWRGRLMLGQANLSVWAGAVARAVRSNQLVKSILIHCGSLYRRYRGKIGRRAVDDIAEGASRSVASSPPVHRVHPKRSSSGSAESPLPCVRAGELCTMNAIGHGAVGCGRLPRPMSVAQFCGVLLLQSQTRRR
jgi:hypothetical protein